MLIQEIKQAEKAKQIIQTDDDFHSDMQEILIHEDKHANLNNLKLSNPREIIVHKSEDSESKKIEKVTCHSTKISDVKLKSEVLEHIRPI